MNNEIQSHLKWLQRKAVVRPCFVYPYVNVRYITFAKI